MTSTTTAIGGARRGRQAAEELVRGTSIGRYVVLELRGVGAMGAVYEAYDPELDRRVALKILAPCGSGLVDETIQEARALARVSHPNVVTVHDVGRFTGPIGATERVYMAMELVDGVELRAWLQRRHPWAELRRVFLAAGRGLAAAHDAGLVHRDFKPSNVLVGERSVKVVDFGLAVPAAEDQAVAFAGTPWYMPPEVLAGARPDARADVYAFCVVLYEAIYGASPFTAEGPQELLAAKRAPLRLGRAPGAPRRIPRLLLRGLAAEPDRRVSSMHEVLTELDREPRLHRYAVLVAALLVILWVAWGRLRAPSAEAEAERRIAEVWSPAARTRLHVALAEGPEAHRARLSALLDAYAGAWVSAYAEVQRTPAAGPFDPRLTCLGERLEALRAQIAVLTHRYELPTNRAIDAVLRLPAVERCSDAESAGDADAAADPRVVSLGQKLLEIDALERAGLWTEGLQKAQETWAEVKTLDQPEGRARALLRLGMLEERSGQFAAAEESLLAASELAERVRDDDTAALAGVEALWVIGYRSRRFEEALLWSRHVRALTSRSGHDPSHHALFLGYLGVVLEAAGRYDEAEEVFERALSVQVGLAGQSPLFAALLRSSLAGLCSRRGAYAEAYEGHRRAIAEIEHWYGAEHPELAGPLLSLGAALTHLGRLDEAEQALLRALAVFERGGDREHVDAATAYNNLGILAVRRAEWSAARGHLERALAIYRRAYGESHTAVAGALTNLALVALREADYEVAVDTARQALSRFAEPQHPTRVASLTFLAVGLRMLGRCEEAAAHLFEGLSILEAGVHDLPAEEARLLGHLAEVERCRGRLAAAVRAGERSLARAAALDTSSQRHAVTALAHLVLAELSVDRGAAREAAHHLEETAAAGLDAGVELRPRYELVRARLLREEGAREAALALGARARDALAARAPASPEVAEASRWLAAGGRGAVATPRRSTLE